MDNIDPSVPYSEPAWQPALDALSENPAIQAAEDMVHGLEYRIRTQPVASVLIALLAGIGLASAVSHLTDPRLRPHRWHR